MHHSDISKLLLDHLLTVEGGHLWGHLGGACEGGNLWGHLGGGGKNGGTCEGAISGGTWGVKMGVLVRVGKRG